MEETAVLVSHPEEMRSTPCDLDDLIFQGEPWYISER